MRPLRHACHLLENVRAHSKLVQLDGAAAPVEKTEHDTFAEHGWHGRDPQIQLAALESNADTPILWAPALSDIHLG